MKKQFLLFLFCLFSFCVFSQNASFHRVKIIGQNAKDVCDYYSGNNNSNNRRKINFFGLTNNLTIGQLYYINSNYFVVTEVIGGYEQDADDDWVVTSQPNPITSYYCNRYIKLKRIGDSYSQASNNFCTKSGLDEIKINYYWTGANLLTNKIYKIKNKYYKVLYVSISSNQDADENWYGYNISNPINFSCKKYHRLKYLGTSLGQVYTNCSTGSGREIKVNLININSPLLLNKVYRLNNVFYKVVYSSNFQNQDADDDIYVNSLIGPYQINIGNCSRSSMIIASVYDIYGVNVKDKIEITNINQIKEFGLKKGIYIIKSKNFTKKVYVE